MARITLLITTLIPLTFMIEARAAHICVDSANDFHYALQLAGSNGENDTIQIETGLYDLDDMGYGSGFVFDATHDPGSDLDISGGWITEGRTRCAYRINDARKTLITRSAPEPNPALLTILPGIEGDVRIRNLSFLRGSNLEADELNPEACGGGIAVLDNPQTGPAQGSINVSNTYHFLHIASYGSGLCIRSGNIVEVVNNSFIHNTAYGSATIDIRTEASERITIANNTLYGNHAGFFGEPAGGAGISVRGTSSTAWILNNLSWNTLETDIFLDDAIAQNTIFLHNDYETLSGQPGTMNGNMQIAPVFQPCMHCFAYPLKPGSPLVDAGHHPGPGSGWQLPSTDLVNLPRVVGAAVDIGAYETVGNPGRGRD